jgi:hypothetical protein
MCTTQLASIQSPDLSQHRKLTQECADHSPRARTIFSTPRQIYVYNVAPGQARGSLWTYTNENNAFIENTLIGLCNEVFWEFDLRFMFLRGHFDASDSGLTSSLQVMRLPKNKLLFCKRLTATNRLTTNSFHRN